MPTELTNLMPAERKDLLAREYLFHLGTLACLMITLALVVHGILLVPAQAYLREQQAVQEKRLTELSSQRASSGFEDVSARVTALSTRAAALESLAKTHPASDTIRALLDFQRPGITLTGFTFTPANAEGKGGMTLTGMAATRTSLRAFDDALSALPFVTSTDLPLSAYAKESDIPFSIALVLTFKP